MQTRLRFLVVLLLSAGLVGATAVARALSCLTPSVRAQIEPIGATIDGVTAETSAGPLVFSHVGTSSFLRTSVGTVALAVGR